MNHEKLTMFTIGYKYFLSFFLGFCFVYTVNAEPFRVGEKLHYRIKWGFVTAGYSSMSVLRRMSFRGVDCLVFQTRARSSGLIKILFPVNDKITSYWDPLKRRTLFSEKKIHEGNYIRTSRVIFNHRNHTATWHSDEFSGNTGVLGRIRKNARRRKRSGVVHNIPDLIQDMLSAVYFNRSHPEKGKAGSSFFLDIFDDNRLTGLKMEIIRREKIRIRVNNISRHFNALVVRPFFSTTGIFKSKGKILLWISDDNRRWPLIIKAKVPVAGSITVRIYKATGVGNWQ